MSTRWKLTEAAGGVDPELIHDHYAHDPRSRHMAVLYRKISTPHQFLFISKQFRTASTLMHQATVPRRINSDPSANDNFSANDEFLAKCQANYAIVDTGRGPVDPASPPHPRRRRNHMLVSCSRRSGVQHLRHRQSLAPFRSQVAGWHQDHGKNVRRDGP